MEKPFETYEKITGKKWTGGNSAEVQSAYKDYGITAPAGSAEANLALQKAMNDRVGQVKPNPVIASQNKIATNTAMQDRKDQENGKKLDAIVSGVSVTDAKTNSNNQVVAPQNQQQNQDQQQNNQTGTTTTTTTGTVTTPNNDSGLKDTSGFSYTTVPPTGYNDLKLTPLQKGERFVFDKDGKPFIDDGKGNLREDPTMTQQYNTIAQKNKDTAQKEATYTAMKANLDASHQVLVDRIMMQSKEQKAKMEDVNKRMLEIKRQAGYRTGGAEYSSEINSGILEDTETKGLARIKEIDDNTAMLLAQAVQAKSDKDFELMEKKMTAIDNMNKEKTKAVQDIYQAYIDNAKFLQDQEKALKAEERAVKDQALQEIKISAPNLYKAYDSLKTTAEKNVFLEKLVAKTGLDTSVIMGSMDIAREDVKKEKAGSKPTEGEMERGASSSIAKSMDKYKGADGYISPEDWIFYRQEWVKAGRKAKDFNDNFKIYLNPEAYSTAGLE